ncbi:MAG: hypothetical protein ACQEUN_17135 [Pseudomonadota bacterium]
MSAKQKTNKKDVVSFLQARHFNRKRATLMRNSKTSYSLVEAEKPTTLNDEVLDFWGEKARIQLSYMEAISAYLNEPRYK